MNPLDRRPVLCLVTDRGFFGHSKALIETVALAVEAGVTMVQYREKGGPPGITDRESFDLAKRLAQLVWARGGQFLVNDRVDLAMAVGADGVHLGQDDLPIQAVRRIWPQGGLVGVSARSLGEVQRALVDQPDYIGFGAVFPTSTKSDAVVSNLEVLRQAVELSTVPVLAIGGIGVSNVRSVSATGCAGVAVVSAILGAEAVPLAVRALLEPWVLRP